MGGIIRGCLGDDRDANTSLELSQKSHFFIMTPDFLPSYARELVAGEIELKNLFARKLGKFTWEKLMREGGSELLPNSSFEGENHV